MENSNNNQIDNSQINNANIEGHGIQVTSENAVSQTNESQNSIQNSVPGVIDINEAIQGNNSVEVNNQNNIQSNNVANNQQVTKDNTFYEKERRVWPIVLLIIILLVGGFGSYYYFVMTKPMNVLTRVFNNAYKYLESNSKELMGISGKELNSLSVDSNITFTSSDESLSSFSGLNAKVSIGYDLTNNDKNIVDANIKLNDSTLIDAAATLSKGVLYLDLKNVLDKVVAISDESMSLNTDNIKIDNNKINQEIEDYLYVVNLVKNTILKNISEEKLLKEIILKDFDNKKIPVIEIQYKLDYPEYKKLYNSLIDVIINDQKALKIVADLSGKETEKLKQSMMTAKDDLSELDFGGDTDIVLDIDVFTNKIVNLNAKDKDSELNYKTDSSESNLQLVSKENGTIDITLDKNENKIFIDVKLLEDEKTQRYNITMKMSKASNTEETINVSFIMYSPDEVTKEMINLTGEFIIKINGEIKPLDIANSVKNTNLTQEEQEKIMNALSSAMKLFEGSDNN